MSLKSLRNHQILEINHPVTTVQVGSGVQGTIFIRRAQQVTVNVEKNGHIEVVFFMRHKPLPGCTIIIHLLGKGATARVSGSLHGHQHDQQTVEVMMHHAAPNTKGDILIRGVFQDQSRGFISGLLRIDKKAQGVDSYFADDVLLFDQAMAIAEPRLEILANDVRASHGSTTGRVDEEQLFYLMSRGLKKEVAEKMIISGFLNKVISRFPEAVLPIISQKKGNNKKAK